jgi:hypothetical protein
VSCTKNEKVFQFQGEKWEGKEKDSDVRRDLGSLSMSRTGREAVKRSVTLLHTARTSTLSPSFAFPSPNAITAEMKSSRREGGREKGKVTERESECCG